MVGTGQVQGPAVGAALCLAALLPALPAAGAGRYVEDIQVSRSGREAKIEVSLACPMRVESDLATDEGSVVEVHLRPLDACKQVGGDEFASEAYRPRGGALAGLGQVEYEALGLGESFLLLRFDQSVDYRVAQRGNPRSLELIVRLPESFEERP